MQHKRHKTGSCEHIGKTKKSCVKLKVKIIFLLHNITEITGTWRETGRETGFPLQHTG